MIDLKNKSEGYEFQIGCLCANAQTTLSSRDVSDTNNFQQQILCECLNAKEKWKKSPKASLCASAQASPSNKLLYKLALSHT